MASHGTATTHIHIATKRTHIRSFSHNCMSTWKRIALTSKNLRFASRSCYCLVRAFCVCICKTAYIHCEPFNSHRLIAFDLLLVWQSWWLDSRPLQVAECKTHNHGPMKICNTISNHFEWWALNGRREFISFEREGRQFYAQNMVKELSASIFNMTSKCYFRFGMFFERKFNKLSSFQVQKLQNSHTTRTFSCDDDDKIV